MFHFSQNVVMKFVTESNSCPMICPGPMLQGVVAVDISYRFMIFDGTDENIVRPRHGLMDPCCVLNHISFVVSLRSLQGTEKLQKITDDLCCLCKVAKAMPVKSDSDSEEQFLQAMLVGH